MRTRDCDVLGLSSGERAALTGFTRRTVGALAHLREAWCIADPQNQAAVEAAIRKLLASHSLDDIRPICARVLTAGFDEGRGAEFLARIGLGVA